MYEDNHTKKSAICLYTKEKSFYIKFDSTTERNEWLGFMINSQKNINDSGHDVSLKETFGNKLYTIFLFCSVLTCSN